ncbi:MAG: sigma-70 family RNA polymerase sigma factor [Planctomycetes bacterium]|nr:sigma-70 family RNA polymerase sigma factor [Planctomycetota bacterium]
MANDSVSLARSAAQGDEAALAQLLERHLPSVRAFVRCHMGPELRARESTSDVVQSVCRELLTHRDAFRHPDENGFQAWLFTTARRKIANRARDIMQQKRDARREVADLRESAIAALGGAYSRVSTPSARALVAEEVERLEAAIEQLPEEQREVITLAHLAGLSRAEIGERMGRSEEAVRALLHRAMARLMILLDGDGAGAD